MRALFTETLFGTFLILAILGVEIALTRTTGNFVVVIGAVTLASVPIAAWTFYMLRKIFPDWWQEFVKGYRARRSVKVLNQELTELRHHLEEREDKIRALERALRGGHPHR